MIFFEELSNLPSLVRLGADTQHVAGHQERIP